MDLYDFLNSEEIPAFHLSSFTDLDQIPEKFFVFNNIQTRNIRADNEIVLESLLYQVYLYSSSPAIRPIAKAKIKELEAAGIICSPITDIGKIDRKFGLSFTARITQKF